MVKVSFCKSLNGVDCDCEGSGLGPGSETLPLAEFVVLATDPALTNERVIEGTANEIELDDTGAKSALKVGFPNQVVFTGTMPKCTVIPTDYDHLVNLLTLHALILSSFGQSIQINNLLGPQFVNNFHIFYNKAGVSSSSCLFIPSGKTLEVLEVVITTKGDMPQWPAYIMVDTGGGLGTNLSDQPFFMLPEPGSTKTYIFQYRGSTASRTVAAGTYTSLWDNTTTEVVASPTSYQSLTTDTFGLVWGSNGISLKSQIIENYDPAQLDHINLLDLATTPSDYIDSIQIRGREP